MKELEEIKRYLTEFKKMTNRINTFVKYRLQGYSISIDFDRLLDDIKYLFGYIDCMIDFKIEIPQDISLV